jgi:hypothetical protein
MSTPVKPIDRALAEPTVTVSKLRVSWLVLAQHRRGDPDVPSDWVRPSYLPCRSPGNWLSTASAVKRG